MATGFDFRQGVTTVSSPVSVAFGKDHLYILGTTTVESHRIDGAGIDAVADGVITLLRADGSAAQVGVVGDQLVISEKSGAIEVADVRGGAVVGPAVAVSIPADSDTPFGLVTRGSNGYVTIAHSDEISLIKNGQLVGADRDWHWIPERAGSAGPVLDHAGGTVSIHEQLPEPQHLAAGRDRSQHCPRRSSRRADDRRTDRHRRRWRPARGHRDQRQWSVACHPIPH